MVVISVNKSIISIDSLEPEIAGTVSIESSDVPNSRRWIESLYGMYGNVLSSDNERPIDLFAGVVKSGMDYEIIEGHEILDLPLEEIPEGSCS